MKRRDKGMGWVLPAGAALLVGLVAAEAQTGPKALTPVTVTYGPMASGAGESAKLAGPDDQKGVFYTTRIHLKAGGMVAPHSHPDSRYVTVLSGTLSVCTSETASADAALTLPAGSFLIEPAGVVHCSWARDGDVVYQESGIGPTAVIPIKK